MLTLSSYPKKMTISEIADSYAETYAAEKNIKIEDKLPDSFISMKDINIKVYNISLIDENSSLFSQRELLRSTRKPLM